MDVSQYNTRVIKEPRGMIRVLQLVFAILAFATTSGFDTTTSFVISCAPNYTSIADVSSQTKTQTITYDVEYPFNFEDQIIKIPTDCRDDPREHKLDMDFSSSAQFFVATGVLSFLYTIAISVLYVFGSHYYETNPLVPVVDLVASGVLTIFWLSGASAWAAGVSDVKHYTHPSYLRTMFPFCNKAINDPGDCYDEKPGKWASLNISLIFGFANIFLWAASMWFVYKETTFHRQQSASQLPPQGVPPSGFGGYGDQASGQQRVPQQTTNFPQQKQFADGY